MVTYFQYLWWKKQWLGLDEEEVMEFHRQWEGYKGEQKFEQLIGGEIFQDANWECLLDWTVAEDGVTQIDALLLLPHQAILINVKHYNQSHQHQRSNRISSKVSRQLENSRYVLWSIFEKLGWKLPIKTALVFMNEEVPHCYLQDSVNPPNYVVQSVDVYE